MMDAMSSGMNIVLVDSVVFVVFNTNLLLSSDTRALLMVSILSSDKSSIVDIKRKKINAISGNGANAPLSAKASINSKVSQNAKTVNKNSERDSSGKVSFCCLFV